MASKNKKITTVKPHVKTGDNVIVISGKYKGKTGAVIRVLPKKNRVVVEGVQMVTKHQKPTQQSEGGVIQMEAPIHLSNVMHVTNSGEPTRIGRREENGKMVRYAKKTGELI